MQIEQTATPQDWPFAFLTLATLGALDGDTRVLHRIDPLPITRPNILGVLSLILVISLKCLAFGSRADNRGDGGIVSHVGGVQAGP
ncbi:MAG: hypothetical protein KGK44_10330 [Gammaproteobacteria bacterium]|nr:hypothetical protein [Gammaproteobacteria bacterium]